MDKPLITIMKIQLLALLSAFLALFQQIFEKLISIYYNQKRKQKINQYRNSSSHILRQNNVSQNLFFNSIKQKVELKNEFKQIQKETRPSQNKQSFQNFDKQALQENEQNQLFMQTELPLNKSRHLKLSNKKFLQKSIQSLDTSQQIIATEVQIQNLPKQVSTEKSNQIIQQQKLENEENKKNNIQESNQNGQTFLQQSNIFQQKKSDQLQLGLFQQTQNKAQVEPFPFKPQNQSQNQPQLQAQPKPFFKPEKKINEPIPQVSTIMELEDHIQPLPSEPKQTELSKPQQFPQKSQEFPQQQQNIPLPELNLTAFPCEQVQKVQEVPKKVKSKPKIQKKIEIKYDCRLTDFFMERIQKIDQIDSFIKNQNVSEETIKLIDKKVNQRLNQIVKDEQAIIQTSNITIKDLRELQSQSMNHYILFIKKLIIKILLNQLGAEDTLKNVQQIGKFIMLESFLRITPICYFLHMLNVQSPFVVEYALVYLVRRFKILIPYVPDMKDKTEQEKLESLGVKFSKDNVQEPYEDFIKSVEKYSYMYFCLLSIQIKSQGFKGYQNVYYNYFKKFIDLDVVLVSPQIIYSYCICTGFLFEQDTQKIKNILSQVKQVYLPKLQSFDYSKKEPEVQECFAIGTKKLEYFLNDFFKLQKINNLLYQETIFDNDLMENQQQQ